MSVEGELEWKGIVCGRNRLVAKEHKESTETGEDPTEGGA